MDSDDSFRWAYAIARSDAIDAPVLQYFDRLHHAREVLKILQEAYPDIPLTIFIPGDQMYIPISAHDRVH